MKNIDIPKFSSVESNTFKAALVKFNDIYRNPESNLSPEHVKKLIADHQAFPQLRNQIEQELKQIKNEITKNADDNKDPGSMLKLILSMMHKINI